MNARYFTIAASALVLGAPLLGGPSLLGGLAIAGGKTDLVDARQAAKAAKSARKALAKRDMQRAVSFAEAAVSLDPGNGDHRKLLGEAYLLSGRFASAAQALSDALSLDPADGRTALNLTLAQIATGSWTAARETLGTYAGTIPASDRGLAYALAGDPGTAVELLGEAARQPDADAKTRQNLALSLALAGQWQQAKTIASLDLPPDQLDARIMQWASFSRPQNAYDQVAALLNVTAVMDNGQPERLALNRTAPVAVAVQQMADPVDNYMPGQAPVEVAAAVPPAAPATEASSDTAIDLAAPAITAPNGQQIIFAERREIVQALPASAAQPVRVASAPVPAKAREAKVERVAFTPERGQWFVQLGAYDNSGVARDAWGRAVKRVPVLSGMIPSSVSVTTSVGQFQRLSVGGFTRTDANTVCRKVRASGGNCFVRTSAGDRVASWASGARLASR